MEIFEKVKNAYIEGRVTKYHWSSDGSCCQFYYIGIDNHGCSAEFATTISRDMAVELLSYNYDRSSGGVLNTIGTLKHFCDILFILEDLRTRSIIGQPYKIDGAIAYCLYKIKDIYENASKSIEIEFSKLRENSSLKVYDQYWEFMLEQQTLDEFVNNLIKK